jgi:hypothetical protein
VHNIVATKIVVKFDVKGVYLLLLQVYLHLNFVKATIKPTMFENDCFFKQIVFVDDTIIPTLKNELKVFQWLCVI